MTTSLQDLKIPRGYRGDWPIFEYELIDYVESNTAELENAREGDDSLLANLNTKYASKSYVQLALLNPTPGDIVVTDLAVAALDSTKVGYSLQVNNAGTGLIFGNTYRLGLGTFVSPALNFNIGANAGMYCVSSATEETLKVKLNNILACEVIQNKVSGVTIFDMGSFQVDSFGDMIAEDLNIKSIAASEDIACRSLRAIGSGPVLKSVLAEVEVGKGYFPGVGVNATVISEATIAGATISTFTAGAITVLSGVNLDTYRTVTKDYYADATCTNLPSTGAGGGHLRTTFYNSNNVIQFFIGVYNSGMASRFWDGGVWSAWQVGTGSTGATGPQGPQGPTGPAGPTGATGPAGPSVTYTGNTPYFSDLTTGVSTLYSIPPNKTVLILLIAGGGGGGEGGPTAGVYGNSGSDSIISNSANTVIMASAYGGRGGEPITTAPPLGNTIAKQDLDRFNGSWLRQVALDNDIQYSLVQSSSNRTVLSMNPSVLAYWDDGVGVTFPGVGYGGTGSLASGIYGQKGGAGGYIYLTCKNTHPSLSRDIRYYIGAAGSAASPGVRGGGGAIYIWLSN